MTQFDHERFIKLSRYYARQVDISRDITADHQLRAQAQRQMKAVEKEQEKMLETLKE